MARRAISRGIVTAYDDTGDVPLCQVQVGPDASEAIPDLECLQPAGLSHVPTAASDGHGAEAVVAETSAGLDVVSGLSDRRRRQKGHSAGDTVLFGTHHATAADNARVECLTAAVAVKGKPLTVDSTCDASGYKAGGTAGKTGVKTIVTDAGTLTLTFKGGILTATDPIGWMGD